MAVGGPSSKASLVLCLSIGWLTNKDVTIYLPEFKITYLFSDHFLIEFVVLFIDRIDSIIYLDH